MSRALFLFALSTLALPSTVRADIQKDGPEEFPGKNEISLHLGGQAGFNGYTVNGFEAGGPPSGGHFIFEYGRLISKQRTMSVWLDMGVSSTFAGGPGVVCYHGGCDYGSSGIEVSPFFGVKLKWRTPIPLVPYAKFNAQMTGIFDRFCGDNGFGLLAHAAGGLEYFLTRSIGVGLETGVSFGPAFYDGTSGNGGCPDYIYVRHTELYLAGEFVAGVEFIF